MHTDSILPLQHKFVMVKIILNGTNSYCFFPYVYLDLNINFCLIDGSHLLNKIMYSLM